MTGKYNILICTDFAFPKFGGVETHTYQLAQCLIERGHKVIFVTNKFKNQRSGMRYMANGMKVYHFPHMPVVQGDVAFLSFFNSLPLIRQILIREHIDIVHGHQSTSILQHIIMLAAKSYGIKTVFTEHSLYGYGDMQSIHINKIIKWSFRDLDAAVCVSQACKDNFVLRAKVNPQQTFTIPNAVDSMRFTPSQEIKQDAVAKSGNPNTINIVYVSRLQYRKGVDLLIGIIPKIVAQYSNVNFIIGGDGDGMVDLEMLIERYNLHGRVELLGGLPHDQVRDVLCRGHIFLNTSLTESFCIAILEAACCGLLVVTTNVGGVPEVLPPHMAYLAKPEEKSIVRQLCKAIQNVKEMPCETFYNELSDLYSWRQVAERTERVYDYVIEKPVPNALARLKSSFSWGPVVGIWALFYTIIEAITLCFTEYFLPEEDIDVCRTFSAQHYNSDIRQFGDHKLFVDSNDTRISNKADEIVITQQYKHEVRKQNHNQRFVTVRPSECELSKPEPICMRCQSNISSCQSQSSEDQSITEETIQTQHIEFNNLTPSKVYEEFLSSEEDEIRIIQSEIQEPFATSTPIKKNLSIPGESPESSGSTTAGSPQSEEKERETIIEAAIDYFLSHDSQMQVE